jgi:1-pyrroline-5-carboxylate dehydrogenase
MTKVLQNLVNGKWCNTKKYDKVFHVLNGTLRHKVPNTSKRELLPFINSIQSTSKSGLHNPFKNPERYLLLGDVCFRTAHSLHDKNIQDTIIDDIIAVTGKTDEQAHGELVVSRKFLENFSGDQVRFLAKGFNTPGDHFGQISSGFRWPYGSVAIVSPFNFPLEIPLLQLMGSLFMGNKPLLKVDSRVSSVMDAILKLMHQNGLPEKDVDFIHCNGKVMQHLLLESKPRLTQFTGSTKVAETLSKSLHGKVRIEGGGFDWKIIGHQKDIEPDLVYNICSKDAYSFSGQKCSAQSMLFIHDSWDLHSFQQQLKIGASKQIMGPILTLSNQQFTEHVDKLLQIKGAKLWFGNQPKYRDNIPEHLGYMEPTAIYIPLEHIHESNIELVTKEIFGPFQVVTSYDDIDKVLHLCEQINDHLTAAVVSNDPTFVNYVLGHTVNGTTYTGEKARTTGAPQNHWFGPCGDPRSAGIGTSEAIIQTWSCHREIIKDE